MTVMGMGGQHSFDKALKQKRKQQPKKAKDNSELPFFCCCCVVVVHAKGQAKQSGQLGMVAGLRTTVGRFDFAYRVCKTVKERKENDIKKMKTGKKKQKNKQPMTNQQK